MHLRKKVIWCVCIYVYTYEYIYSRRPLGGVLDTCFPPPNTERGYPEPFGLLESGTSCTKSWMLLRRASHTVPERFSGFFVAVFLPKISGPPLNPPQTPLDPLDNPRPPWTPCPASNCGFACREISVWRAFYEVVLCTSFPKMSWTRMRLPCLDPP